MTKQLPVGLLVVGISLIGISLCVRSPAPPKTHTDELARPLSARAIVVEPTTKAVTISSSDSD